MKEGDRFSCPTCVERRHFRFGVFVNVGQSHGKHGRCPDAQQHLTNHEEGIEVRGCVRSLLAARVIVLTNHTQVCCAVVGTT